MTFVPLKITGKCVADDETLFTHMENAVARGYPQITKPDEAKDGAIALVASGPSVASQIDVIKKMQANGVKIVAIKDAHDWLLTQGVIPNYALAIDPQEHRISFYTFSLSGVSMCERTRSSTVARRPRKAEVRLTVRAR